MTAKIIDGKQMAEDIRGEVALGVKALTAATGVTPGLAAVLVGEDPASAIYVRNKRRACEEAGIFSETFDLPETTTQDELLALIAELNADDRFHGILVQLPLPPQISERTVILAVDPERDVDGLHPLNAGLLLQGQPRFVPATPAGVQEMLVRGGGGAEGRGGGGVGRCDSGGRARAALVMQEAEGANAAGTVCHTGTPDIGAVTRWADSVVAAMGRTRASTADMVREGAVVIDVGINRVEDASRKAGYRLVGDVDFEPVSEKASAISPVPGGVGPMTIAMLLKSTLRAAERAAGSREA